VNRAWRLGTLVAPFVGVLAVTWMSALAVPAPVGWTGWARDPGPNRPLLAAAGPDAARAALDYWSPRRIATATSLPPAAAPAAARRIGTAGTPAGRVPPARPGTAAFTRPTDSTGDVWSGAYGRAPAATTGKLFVETPDGPGECSGTVLNSVGKDLVLTAAHCIHGGKGSGFFRNFVFVPGQHGNARPFGAWAARAWTVLSNWAEASDMRYDVGILVMQPRNGRHIAEVTGGQGLAWNERRGLPATVLGYPRGPGAKYGGNWLAYCQGVTLRGDWGRHRIACDMGQGASGGPWVVRPDRRGLGFVYTVNSTYTGDAYYGPYFDGKVGELYSSVAAR
jgi:V8-like Glu-specific endopeptidase